MEFRALNATGAFVCGGPALMIPGSPGIKKSRGEKVCDAAMPPHPATTGGSAANSARHGNFQLIITCRV